MRAYQFINEYDRDKTAGPLRQQILQNFSKHSILGGKPIPDEDADRTIRNIMGAIEAGDPTPNKLYTPWLTREYAKGRIKRLEDIGSRLTPLLKTHFENKNKRDFPPKLKDIMSIKADEFESGMSQFTPPEPEIKNRGESRQVYDGPTARIIVPEDETAACYYGQGTRWCTASTKGDNYFDQYNRRGDLYIVIPKKPKYEGEKYQFHFEEEQFMDEQDDPIDLLDFFNDYPELEKVFFNLVPEIQDSVIFAKDEVLTNVMGLLVQPLQDYISDLINDWSTEDSYFYEWQLEQAKERGYVTDDGEVDFDRMWEDDDLNDYIDFNDEAYQLNKFASGLSKITASEIRDVAVMEHAEGNGLIKVDDLPKILYGYTANEIGEDFPSVLEFINRKLEVIPASSTYRKSKNLNVVGETDGYIVITL